MKDKGIKVVYNADNIDSVVAAHLLYRQYGTAANYIPKTLLMGPVSKKIVNGDTTVFVLGLSLSDAEIIKINNNGCRLVVVDTTGEQCHRYDSNSDKENYIIEEDHTSITDVIYDNFYVGHGTITEFKMIQGYIREHNMWRIQKRHILGTNSIELAACLEADEFCYGFVNIVNTHRLRSLEDKGFDPFSMREDSIEQAIRVGMNYMTWAERVLDHVRHNMESRKFTLPNLPNEEFNVEIVNAALNNADFIGRELSTNTDLVVVYEIYQLDNCKVRFFSRNPKIDCLSILNNSKLISGHGEAGTGGFSTTKAIFDQCIAQWTRSKV